MSVNRYDLYEEDNFPWSAAIALQNEGDFVLHSDYIDLLARYNALKEAIKTMIKTESCRNWDGRRMNIEARAEVDRLLGGE